MNHFHLAIDTACGQPTVALLDGAELLEQWFGETGPFHGEQILIGVDHCLRLLPKGMRPQDALSFLSVGIGPGSFTGLRIGVTTTKFLAAAWNKCVVPISSLHAQAMLTMQSQEIRHRPDQRIWSLIDARRHELYACLFTARQLMDNSFEIQPEDEFAVVPEAFCEKIQPNDILIGDGAVAFADLWPEEATVFSANPFPLQAKFVGKLGFERFSKSGAMSPEQVMSKYFRTEKF